MMKMLFFLIFIIPICFINNMFWMVQNMLFLLSFIFIIMNYFDTYFMNLSYFLGCDLISYSLILLSLWITSLMIMASESINKMNNYSKLFIFNILMLLLFLFLAFGNNNLFMFYLFFESSLIPTLFLILGWGYQPERLQAGLYLLFYTLLVSLPMLIGLFYLYNKIGSMNFYMMSNYMFDFDILYMFKWKVSPSEILCIWKDTSPCKFVYR